MRRAFVFRFAVALLSVGFNTALAATAPKAENFGTFEAHVSKVVARENRDIPLAKHQTRLMSHGHLTEHVVLIFHGLHASPEAMADIAEAYFNRGSNVINVNLAGHFRRDPKSIAEVSYRDWIRQSEAYMKLAKSLGKKLTLVGMSTGGTLATRLSLRYPDDVSSLVLIGPALALSNKVVISSQLLGFTPLTSSSLCENLKDRSPLCRLLLSADPQIAEMMSNGQVSAPAAGRQVQRLIDTIADEFFPVSRETVYDYFERLRAVYSHLRTPLFLVTTDIDNVVDVDFIRSALKPEASIEFAPRDGVKHIYLTHSETHPFPISREAYNHQFETMLNAMMEFAARH